MARYESYRASECSFLDEIPSNWTLLPLKRLADIWYGIGEPPRYHTTGTPLVRATNVHAGKILSESMVFVDAEEIPAGRILWLEPGDIIVVRSGAYTGDSAIIPRDFGAAIAGFDMVLRPRKADPSFLQHALLSFYVKTRQLDVERMRAAQPHLNLAELGSCLIAVPPASEQEAIAAFLNRETGKIDALVEEQERLIELLREKRQAVISHAVTKGLNVNAAMKPSGIEWLGEVPAHWVVVPIRKVATLESGHTPSRQHPEYWQDCTVPWFTLADVWRIRQTDTEYVYETKELVSELGLANSSARLLPAGTVMLSRTASVGFSTIMGVPMATTQDFANWICGPRLLPDFLLFVLRSMSGEFRRLMMGSTHNTIYMPDIQSLTLALPPRPEQERIVAHIRSHIKGFDDLISEAERAADLLRERRSALINAAVTGQIDVRHLSAADVA